MFDKLRDVLRRVVAWQKKPIQVPENINEAAVCKNCGDEYAGNYCPRCGQSCNTPRLGSKSAIRIFLDTWGLGTNGLLRTIWHLFTRPGYMIGDYIDGRRQLFFPPFKTLFVIGTAFALVFTLAGGFSEEAIQARNQEIVVETDLGSDATAEANGKPLSDKEQARDQHINLQIQKDIGGFYKALQRYDEWQQHNKLASQLLLHLIFALLAWRVFRKSPRHPNLNIAENIIAQVYICAQMGVAALLIMLVEIPFTPYPSGVFPLAVSFLLFAYDYKQLFGYGVWRTLWKTLLMYVLFFLLTILVVALFIFFVGVRAGFAAIG